METKPENTVGRNEPCPCGSGKKYKRCHGVGAEPKLTPPKGMPPGMPSLDQVDPRQMDPKMMSQMMQALNRLPRGQMQRLQSLMQKAMAGKDVSLEAEEFEKTLPSEFKSLIQGFQASGMAGGGPMPETPLPATAPEADDSMSEKDAMQIVAQAAAEGKISTDQAQELLGQIPNVPTEAPVKTGFWRTLTRSKSQAQKPQ